MTPSLFTRVLLFSLASIVLYIGAVGGLSHLDFRGRPVVEHLLKRSMEPGGYGHTLRRFRDLRHYTSVDLLFAGSSHAYRAFDPRPYIRRGVQAYNIGSSSQTPLNSYYLLAQQVPRLRPEVVVYELYPQMLEVDGFEAGQDLIINLPISVEILRMTLALRNPDALLTLIAAHWHRLHTPIETVPDTEADGERYINGGYVEKTDSLTAFPKPPPQTWTLAPRQMDYLRQIVALCRTYGAEIVFVSHPLPTELLDSVPNAEETYERLGVFAQQENVLYKNFNGELELNTTDHFFDDDHLNAAGVALFNDALLAWLKQSELLPKDPNGRQDDLPLERTTASRSDGELCTCSD